MEEINAQAIEERELHATRERVDQLLAEGWSIVGRDPLIMQRGSRKLEVRRNGIIVQA